MFARLVYESFRRQKRRKLLAGVAITLGVGVATAMIAVATDIGDKINRELRTYGANLDESDLPKIRGTFWHHNIVGFSPMLAVTAKVAGNFSLSVVGTYFSKPLHFGKDDFTTGVRITHPWWKVEGAWPEDSSTDILLGERLARTLQMRPGDQLAIDGQP